MVSSCVSGVKKGRFSGAWGHSLELDSGPGRKADGILGRRLEAGMAWVLPGKSSRESDPALCSSQGYPPVSLLLSVQNWGMLGLGKDL